MGAPQPHLVLAVTGESTARAFLGGLIDAFIEDGWSVSVVADSTESFDDWAAAHGATAHAMPFAREMVPVQDLRALLRLIAWLRRQKPDAVLAATPKAGLLATVSACLTGVPVRIYQIWGLRLETMSGWRGRLLHSMERIAASSATHVLANSASLAREVVRLGIAPEGKVKVLGLGSSHGVDTDKFSPSCSAELDPQTQDFLSRTDADLTVSYVGRLNPDKGINTVLEAARICFKRGLKVRLIMVGRKDGWEPSDLPADVEQSIHFVGPVPDPRAYVRASDVLCLPTRREGFPNVVLEAAGLGVPTITTNATGAMDSVIDGVTGLLFPVDDAGKLADRFIEAHSDPAGLKKMGAAARARVMEHFRSEHVERLQRDFLRVALKQARR